MKRMPIIKRINTQNYLLIAILLLISSCNNQPTDENQQPQTPIISDTLFISTGIQHLDSLLQLEIITPRDTNLILFYIRIQDIYKNYDYEKAEEYLLKIKDLSEELDWDDGRMEYLSDLSENLYRKGLNDSAIVVLNKAYEYAKEKKLTKWYGSLCINIGNAYFVKDWYETALKYYMEALSIFDITDNSHKNEHTYYLISQVYYYMKFYEKAIEYSKKAVELNPENPYSLYTLGIAYSSGWQNLDKANYYLEKALLISASTNNIYLMEGIYAQMAENATRVFDLKKAEIYINKIIQDEIIKLYMQGILEKLRGNFHLSEQYFLQSLKQSEELEEIEFKKNCYLHLSELTLAQGRHRETVEYWKKRDLIENTIASEQTIRAAAEMEAKYETTKKELEIEKQKHIIEKHNSKLYIESEVGKGSKFWFELKKS